MRRCLWAHGRLVEDPALKNPITGNTGCCARATDHDDRLGDDLGNGIDGLLDELGRVVMMVYSRPAGNFFESSSVVHLIFSAGATRSTPEAGRQHPPVRCERSDLQ